jgi:energy-coupling factor transporter ATP-binding protein EcfA2
MNLLEVNSICKTYGEGENAVHALKEVNFSVSKGEFVAVVGESGSANSRNRKYQSDCPPKLQKSVQYKSISCRYGYGTGHAFSSKKSMILIAGSFAISITLFEATEQNAFHYNCFREHRLHLLAETVSDSLYRLYYLGLPGFLSIFFRRPRTFEVLLSLEVNIRTGRLLSFRSFLIRY